MTVDPSDYDPGARGDRPPTASGRSSIFSPTVPSSRRSMPMDRPARARLRRVGSDPGDRTIALDCFGMPEHPERGSSGETVSDDGRGPPDRPELRAASQHPLGMSGLYANRGPASPIQDGRGYDPSVSNVTYGVPDNGASPLGMPRITGMGHLARPAPIRRAQGTGTIANSLLNSMPPVSKVLAKGSRPTPGSGGPWAAAYP